MIGADRRKDGHFQVKATLKQGAHILKRHILQNRQRIKDAVPIAMRLAQQIGNAVGKVKFRNKAGV